MTPFMAAFVTILVPVILWLFTLSEARHLSNGNDASRGIRIAAFLMRQWPFLLMPIALPWCIYRLIAAELPLPSWLNIAMMVFGPTLLLLWMFRANANAQFYPGRARADPSQR